MKMWDRIKNLEDMQRHLMDRAVAGAIQAGSDEYMTNGGTIKKKTQKAMQLEAAILDERVHALWMAHDRQYTPFYWRVKVLEKAKEKRKLPS